MPGIGSLFGGGGMFGSPASPFASAMQPNTPFSFGGTQYTPADPADLAPMSNGFMQSPVSPLAGLPPSVTQQPVSRIYSTPGMQMGVLNKQERTHGDQILPPVMRSAVSRLPDQYQPQGNSAAAKRR